MSEHAYFRGKRVKRVKIGTCEDMYYLRADQAHLVTLDDQEPHPTDPLNDWADIRFRFPWPDEDDVDPGEFDDHNRSLVIPAHLMSIPAQIRHERVQFASVYRPDYLLVTLCPELILANHIDAMTVTRQSGGAVELIQQRVHGGKLVAVARCVACRSTWRMPTIDDAMPLVVAVRCMADRAGKAGGEGEERAAFLHAVADRVMAGYIDGELVRHFPVEAYLEALS
jgi:hypothetical protein